MTFQAEPNQIDIEFEGLMQFIKERDLSQIVEAVKQNLRHFSETRNQLYKNTMNFINE